MSKDRKTISDELVARVMFASDRTCCVCRTEKLKVQIHHIDSNPSNNGIENLAVICLICHSDAHTSGAFVRRLTPDLVRLYNDSWREIVKRRLVPDDRSTPEFELSSEVLLQLSLDCHSWKVRFMLLAPREVTDKDSSGATDVWDAMEAWIPAYTEQAYQHYAPLFTVELVHVQSKFDRLHSAFNDVLPADLRAQLIRAQRQLSLEASVYVRLPELATAGVIPAGNVSEFYRIRFLQSIHILRDLCRESDRRREALNGSHTDA